MAGKPGRSGRLTTYTEAKAEVILARLERGESLQGICRDEGTPASTVILWVRDNPDFAERYAQARRVGYELLADELLSISDQREFVGDDDGPVRFDAAAVAHNRLRVDTRKWILAKMLPKVYGDRIEHQHSGRIDIATELAKRGADVE